MLIVNLLLPLNSAIITAPFPFASVLSIEENALSIISTFPAPFAILIILYPAILIVDTVILFILRVPLFVYTNPVLTDDDPLVIIILQLVNTI